MIINLMSFITVRKKNPNELNKQFLDMSVMLIRGENLLDDTRYLDKTK